MKKSLSFILLSIFVFNIADCISQNEMIEKFYKLFNYEWKLLKTSDQFKNANKLCYDVIEKEANNTKAVRDACLLTARIQARENEIKNQTQEDNYIKENLERGLAICPNDWELNLELGLLYSNRGDKKNAIKYLTQSIRHNQSDIIALEKIIENYEQSELQVKKDSLARLINYYNLYINLDLKDKDKYIKLYQYQIEVSDIECAKATLLKATNNIEHFTEAKLKLAKLEEQSQNCQLAFDQYSSVLSYDHSNHEAKTGYERLKVLLDKKKLQEIQITQIRGFLNSTTETEWARGVAVCDEILKMDKLNTEAQNYKILLLGKISTYNFDQGKKRKGQNDWQSAFEFFSRSLHFAQEDSIRKQTLTYLQAVAGEAGKVRQVESISSAAKKAYEKGDYTSALYSFVTVQTMNIGRDVQSDISLAEVGDYYLKGQKAFNDTNYVLTHAYITLFCNGDTEEFPKDKVDSAKRMLTIADSSLKKEYTIAFLNENYKNDSKNKNWQSAKTQLEALLNIDPNNLDYQVKIKDVNSKIPKGLPVVFITIGISVLILLLTGIFLIIPRPTLIEFKRLKSERIRFSIPLNGNVEQSSIIETQLSIDNLSLIDLDYIEINGSGCDSNPENNEDIKTLLGKDTLIFRPLNNDQDLDFHFYSQGSDPFLLSAINLSQGTTVNLERFKNKLTFSLLESQKVTSIKLSKKLKLRIGPCKIYGSNRRLEYNEAQEIETDGIPLTLKFKCSSGKSQLIFEVNNAAQVKKENLEIKNYLFKLRNGANLIINDELLYRNVSNQIKYLNCLTEGFADLPSETVNFSGTTFKLKPNYFNELSIALYEDKFMHYLHGTYSKFTIIKEKSEEEKIPSMLTAILKQHPKKVIFTTVLLWLVGMSLAIIDLCK